MSEVAAKELINQERLTLYELITDQKIPIPTGAKALSDLETALGSEGGGGGGSIEIPVVNLTADWRVLTTDTVIPVGSCYVYFLVISGSVTINGLTLLEDEYLNLEPSPFARHPAINIVIPEGNSVRLIRGY